MTVPIRHSTRDSVPVLETGRLILREPRESDLPALEAFIQSDRSVHLRPANPGPSEAWRILSSCIGHWMLRGFGFWTLEERASGRAIGRAGFYFPPQWSEPELGWQVFDGFEGKGLVYEAAMAARAAGPRLFGLNGVISYIVRDNSRSRRLAERMGATVERETELLGKPCLIYRHPRVVV